MAPPTGAARRRTAGRPMSSNLGKPTRTIRLQYTDRHSHCPPNAPTERIPAGQRTEGRANSTPSPFRYHFLFFPLACGDGRSVTSAAHRSHPRPPPPRVSWMVWISPLHTDISFRRSFTSLLAFVSFRYAGISSSAAGAGEASCGGRMVVQKVGSCAPIITIWLSVPPSSFRPIPSDRMLLTFIFVL